MRKEKNKMKIDLYMLFTIFEAIGSSSVYPYEKINAIDKVIRDYINNI